MNSDDEIQSEGDDADFRVNSDNESGNELEDLLKHITTPPQKSAYRLKNEGMRSRGEANARQEQLSQNAALRELCSLKKKQNYLSNKTKNGCPPLDESFVNLWITTSKNQPDGKLNRIPKNHSVIVSKSPNNDQASKFRSGYLGNYSKKLIANTSTIRSVENNIAAGNLCDAIALRLGPYFNMVAAKAKELESQYVEGKCPPVDLTTVQIDVIDFYNVLLDLVHATGSLKSMFSTAATRMATSRLDADQLIKTSTFKQNDEVFMGHDFEEAAKVIFVRNRKRKNSSLGKQGPPRKQQAQRFQNFRWPNNPNSFQFHNPMPNQLFRARQNQAYNQGPPSGFRRFQKQQRFELRKDKRNQPATNKNSQ